ncbi:hypothetical protein STCU_03031 [Strigomonas culicis]|nr:hypothetical protein STCU_03031 [Strigomonas culicis]|eukprot:EPY31992.1 hypothetical protein STCU_03031 [Strigomonas culicis]
MPWIAPSFEDTRAKIGEFLTKKFDVQSIPTLIGVDADTGKVITTKARQTVVADPEGKDFPWPDQ